MKGSIRIMLQNIGSIGNTLYQPSQHNLHTIKNITINEEISIIGITEVNSNWNKITIKDNMMNRTGGWFKTRSISIGYNWATISDGPFQSVGTAIMEVDEVSCRSISICQYLDPRSLVIDSIAGKEKCQN